MKNNKHPIELFKEWLNEEIQVSKVRIPKAVCLSTIGTDGFPNARFVSFKELVDDCFLITGPLKSRKGIEIEKNNKVALTFWWTETERQIRIQGTANRISDQLANKYFSERDLTSQAVSLICDQGKEIDNLEKLETEIAKTISNGEKIIKPANWGGFSIDPTRIEFMKFKETRFHERILCEKENEDWNITKIQP